MVRTPDTPNDEWLDEVVVAVRAEFACWADSYRRRGLQVTGISIDFAGKEVPQLLVFLWHEDIDGQRVLHYPLEHDGRLESASDASMSLAIWALESSPTLLARLPRRGLPDD